jgi:hypothetical protein
MSTIRVDTVYLGELERRCRQIVDSLADAGFAPEVLHRTPPVAEALEEFRGDWEDSREKLAHALSNLAQGFRMTCESFDQTDAALSTALDPKPAAPRASGGDGR